MLKYFCLRSSFQESSDHPPSEFVGSGTIGNGQFALVLSEVTAEQGLSYKYKGEEPAGRTLARYDLLRAPEHDGNTIDLPEGRGTVGMKGSFWADPASYDVVRIVTEAKDIPPELPVSASETSIDYAHTNLGGHDFLLPQSADVRLVRVSGEESHNHNRVYPLPPVRRGEFDFLRRPSGISAVRREFRTEIES